MKWVVWLTVWAIKDRTVCVRACVCACVCACVRVCVCDAHAIGHGIRKAEVSLACMIWKCKSYWLHSGYRHYSKGLLSGSQLLGLSANHCPGCFNLTKNVLMGWCYEQTLQWCCWAVAHSFTWLMRSHRICCKIQHSLLRQSLTSLYHFSSTASLLSAYRSLFYISHSNWKSFPFVAKLVKPTGWRVCQSCISNVAAGIRKGQ